MKQPIRIRSIVALGLSLCLLSLSLFACGANPKGKTMDADTVVGTVDGKDVYYDELYFLVSNYLPSVKDSTKGDPVNMREELDRLIRENITVNFAILKLCESVGLEVDEKTLEKNAKNDLNAEIQSTFGGDKKLYRESLAEEGLTERYLLYTAKIDMMYDSLLSHYPQKGLVISDKTQLHNYIKQNAVRTCRVIHTDYDQISEAYEKLQNGTLTMTQAISKYSKGLHHVYDFFPIDKNDPYEKIASGLKVTDISEIFEAEGTFFDDRNGYERTGSCYFIVQRLSLDNDYITQNFETLKDQYYRSVIAKDMNEIKETLVFVPNDLYEELDLTRLPVARDTVSVWVILLWVGLGVAVVTVGVIVTVILLKKKHRKKNVGVRRAA